MLRSSVNESPPVGRVPLYSTGEEDMMGDDVFTVWLVDTQWETIRSGSSALEKAETNKPTANMSKGHVGVDAAEDITMRTLTER